jgi:redox-sensitive bicupin YhaK (pirin superfamily)
MSAVISTFAIDAMHWKTFDPFLFCAHHDDAYPAGNDAMGPAASLAGRQIGQDFQGKDGWSMYHGDKVPGFPSHPHRGFETVTLARKGFIDHSDSLGAKARFGEGDAQWMTAGKGVVHSEMFPLVHRDRGNPTELFQVWLNLPAEDKMVDPYFTMLWSQDIPQHVVHDDDGRVTEITLVAGSLGDTKAPPPPPNSWAAREEADVAIWPIRMQAGAQVTLPAARSADANRTLYVFEGGAMLVDGRSVRSGTALRLRPDQEVVVANGDQPAELLMLQGRPIGEPVAHYGPFVMNTRAELQQAFADYQRTRFGGWPHERSDPVHPRDGGRFAVHADGREERPS